MMSVFSTVSLYIILIYGSLKITNRLEDAPTTGRRSKDEMNQMVRRILYIGGVLFVVINVKIVTAVVGFVHALCITGLFIYQEDESSYKVMIYAILWEIELLAIVFALSWVVKIRERDEPRTSVASAKSNKAAPTSTYEWNTELLTNNKEPLMYNKEWYSSLATPAGSSAFSQTGTPLYMNEVLCGSPPKHSDSESPKSQEAHYYTVASTNTYSMSHSPFRTDSPIHSSTMFSSVSASGPLSVSQSGPLLTFSGPLFSHSRSMNYSNDAPSVSPFLRKQLPSTVNV